LLRENLPSRPGRPGAPGTPGRLFLKTSILIKKIFAKKIDLFTQVLLVHRLNRLNKDENIYLISFIEMTYNVLIHPVDL